MGEKGEPSFFARPSLPRLLSRAARACTFHDFSKWKACFHSRAYACSTMLKKIKNHDCAFVVSNLYFKLICTSRSCFMTRNLRDSSPFRVAIDARRKKTREHPETGKGTPRPPHAHSGVTFISHDINLNGELFLRLHSPFPRQN